MMVESRNHRLLSFLSVCFGKAAKTLLLLRLLVFRVACRYWVISYSVPFGFSFLLLFLVGERGPCLVRQGARPACRDPYYLLSIGGGGPYMGISAFSMGPHWVHRPGSEVLYKRAQSEANGDQALLDGHDGRLGAVRSPQLAEYSPHVVLDRASTEEQLPGYLLVGAPFGHEPQHLRLPRRKLAAVRLLGRGRGHPPFLGGKGHGGGRTNQSI